MLLCWDSNILFDHIHKFWFLVFQWDLFSQHLEHHLEHSRNAENHKRKVFLVWEMEKRKYNIRLKWHNLAQTVDNLLAEDVTGRFNLLYPIIHQAATTTSPNSWQCCSEYVGCVNKHLFANMSTRTTLWSYMSMLWSTFFTIFWHFIV